VESLLITCGTAEGRVNVVGECLEPFLALLERGGRVGSGGDREHIPAAQLPIPATQPVEALLLFFQLGQGVFTKSFFLVQLSQILATVRSELGPLLLAGRRVQPLEASRVRIAESLSG
jgi:hypothetical protein